MAACTAALGRPGMAVNAQGTFLSPRFSGSPCPFFDVARLVESTP